MRIQKSYVAYCALSWGAWLLCWFLCYTNGTAYGYVNEAVWRFSLDFSRFWVILGLIPIHPVLFFAAAFQSSKYKHKGYMLFNLISFFITAIGYFFHLVCYVWIWGI